jgi:hypothetical protein
MYDDALFLSLGRKRKTDYLSFIAGHRGNGKKHQKGIRWLNRK